MYAREYFWHTGQLHCASSGLKSSVNFALRMFMRPVLENAVPIRAVRVGSTQSNMSMPHATPRTSVVGLPTPMR